MSFPILIALESSKFEISLPTSALQQQAKGSLNNSINFDYLAFGLACASLVARQADMKGGSHPVFISSVLRQRQHTQGDVCRRLD